MGKFLEIARGFKIDLTDGYKASLLIADKKLYVKLYVEVENTEGKIVIDYRRKCFKWEYLVSREKARIKARKWLFKRISQVNKLIANHGIDAEITLNNKEEANHH